MSLWAGDSSFQASLGADRTSWSSLRGSLPRLPSASSSRTFWQAALGRMPRPCSRAWGRGGVWLASKLVHLALLSAAFSLLSQLANGAVQLVWGCGANMPELIGVVARCAALGFPLMLCLALAVNCLAIKLEPVVAFAVVEGIYVAGVVGLAYLPREAAMAVAPWLPFAQGVLAWHDCSGWTSAFSLGVPGFSVVASLAYLGACVALAAVVALRLVRARDIF